MIAANCLLNSSEVLQYNTWEI